MKRASILFIFAGAVAWAGPAAADSPNDDVTPPDVMITAPADQATFEGAPAVVTIAVSAVDPQIPNEWNSGVEAVTVLVDGKQLAIVNSEPYEWPDVQLGEGMHELVARAVDKDGNEGSSPAIHVVVFPASGDTTGDGTSSTGGDGDGDGGGGGGSSSSGCSVSPAQKRNAVGSLVAFAFAVFSASMLRRRRAD